MKRKRGKKKGKAKGVGSKAKATPTVVVEEDTSEAIVNLISLSREENDGDDGNVGNINNDEGYDSPVEEGEEEEEEEEVNTPSSTGTDQPRNVASINPDGSVGNESKGVGKSGGPVYKVKLKSSSNSKELLESQQSDTDNKRSPPVPQLGSEKQVENRASEVQPLKIGVYYSRNSWKRPGSIKIKSSAKPAGESGVEKTGDEKSGAGGGNVAAVAAAKEEGLSAEKEVKTPGPESRYDKQELDSALTVIKKVMKMDAADPFNVPVNPEALGIPDYFDVIDTPMDFGTVCSNLEKGDKYMNSEDVYKDVQYIWDNCYKYNNKGDYILDLMKRVKKNFMKYWVAAGLYNEQSNGSNGSDRIHGDDGVAASQGQVKSGQAKKTKKRHGRRHKHDCLCAICVLKRRRREREENARSSKGQSGGADEQHSQELKQETSSLVESPGGEDSSSNTGESPDGDADEVEGQEMNVEVADRKSGEEKPEEMEEEEEDEEEADDEDNEMDMQQGQGEMPLQSQFVDNLREEPDQQSHPAGIAENSVSVVPMQTQKEYVLGQHDEEITKVQQNKRKFQELKERQEKISMFKKFHVENPLLLGLCGTLFPGNDRSVWSGPHSLFQKQGSTSRSSLHAAIETLMK
ncbi:hypothetical protein Tsubulata_030614 [Turnera subulata]|uniref:Bromo domain-containing protein n=1 Tax=Turnera subulata TaxID=218843 RepID=A0A9Q0JRK0_9ROSI|nr:hypothetical protein Tsubulata_030614 [Turnera subulata]